MIVSSVDRDVFDFGDLERVRVFLVPLVGEVFELVGGSGRAPHLVAEREELFDEVRRDESWRKNESARARAPRQSKITLGVLRATVLTVRSLSDSIDDKVSLQEHAGKSVIGEWGIAGTSLTVTSTSEPLGRTGDSIRGVIELGRVRVG